MKQPIQTLQTASQTRYFSNSHQLRTAPFLHTPPLLTTHRSDSKDTPMKIGHSSHLHGIQVVLKESEGVRVAVGELEDSVVLW